jgi:hypothetical protein
VSDSSWLLSPSGQRANGAYVDDTLRARASESSLRERYDLAADFPRQRVEVLRSNTPDTTVNNLYYRRGWTDGLPIIAPLLPRVDAMVRAAKRGRNDVMAELDPLMGQATVEKVAANAVMAGCTPALMPALIAAVEAIAEPAFNLRGVQTTDENVAPVLLISGPEAERLDINGGFGALGPGARGGATLGRALRLIMQNIGGGWPGAVSMAGLGQPGRYTLCFSEHEALSPWAPLRTELGVHIEHSALIVQRAETVINVTGGLAEIASVMGSAASGFQLAYGGHPCVVISPYTAKQLAASGMSRAAVRQWLYTHGRMDRQVFESLWLRRETIETSRWPEWLEVDGKGPLPVVESADDITVIVAGPDIAIPQHAYLPSWGFPSCRIVKPLA